MGRRPWPQRGSAQRCAVGSGCVEEARVLPRTRVRAQRVSLPPALPAVRQRSAQTQAQRITHRIPALTRTMRPDPRCPPGRCKLVSCASRDQRKSHRPSCAPKIVGLLPKRCAANSLLMRRQLRASCQSRSRWRTTQQPHPPTSRAHPALPALQRLPQCCSRCSRQTGTDSRRRKAL